jgi:Neuraminidase (sialidase)
VDLSEGQRQRAGPGIAMTSDTLGQLYVLWNAGSVNGGPERIFYSTSTDEGNTWSRKVDVSFCPFRY